jgi:cytochrome c oxidase cbb3-type subunit 3
MPKDQRRGTPHRSRSGLALCVGLGAVVAVTGFIAEPWTSFAQSGAASADAQSAAAAIGAMDSFGGGRSAAGLLKVPVGNLYPGEAPPHPNVVDPMANDPEAAQRGQKYFIQFNCVGCHAANGAGGMGPALSNHHWIYGSSPANIYLTILQGRPNGMPAWGTMLPDSVIWDLVAYIRSISQAPDTEWGQTTSAGSATIEQVPAEDIQAVDPWSHIEKFSNGQAPAQRGTPAPSVGNGQ